MKKETIALIAFVSLALFSCTRETLPKQDETTGKQETTSAGYQDPDNPDVFIGGVPVTFSAGMEEDVAGKSTISGNAVSWESGDAIAILWNGGRTVATTEDSGATASFTANVDADAAAGTYYSVYPHSAAGELTEEDVLTVNVPASQDGSFSAANICVSKTTDNTFVFKAIGNLVSFSVTNPDVRKVTIYSYDQTPLAGTCSVNVGGSTPEIDGYTDTSSVIEVSVNGAGTYYAVVLPGTHAEGLLFAPETDESNCRAAFAEKSFEFVRKGNTSFGTLEEKVRDLYVSASGNGKGLSSSDPMSPAAFTALLNQPKVGDEQDTPQATINFALLYGNTINILDDISVDKAHVEFTGGLKTCKFTIKGATASTTITPAGTDRIFEFSNNTNVTIKDLTISGADLASGNGGAILIQNGSNGNADIACENVTFSGNAAAGNGGAVALNAYSKTASFTATGCTFSGNSASGNGGVFYQTASADGNAGKSITTFTNCTFTGNSAVKNGGVAQVYRGTATFGEGNVFTQNSATADGGVFYVNGGAETSYLVVNGGTFGGDSYDVANTEAGTSNGGAILYKEGGNATFTGTTFKYNSATGNAGVAAFKNNTGAALFDGCTFSYNKSALNGGVLYFTNSGAATLKDCKADHNTAVNGGVAQIYKGTLTVEGDESDYRQNTASSGSEGGGCFYLNNSAATLNIGLANTTDKNIKIFQNSGYSGGAIYVKSSAKVNVAHSTFDANEGTKYAGAINNTGGTVTIDNCDIINNKASSSSTPTSDLDSDVTKGTGAGICANGSGAVYDVSSTYFYNNIAGKADNTDSKCYGGAISISGGAVNCISCEFKGNKGNRGSVVLMVNGKGGKFTADKCVFHGNKQYSRGVCLICSKNVAFFNRCSFYDNNLRGTSSCWGIIVQGASNNALCMNNCTANCPNNGYSSNIAIINNDGNNLLTGNTLIGQTPNGSLRYGVAGSKISCVGNVIININTDKASINQGTISSTADYYEGYNIYGALNYADTGGISSTSKTGVAASTFTWATDWYSWAGPSSLSFTAPAQADVTAAYDHFAVDASGWGGCLGSISNVGASFKDWLDSLNPVGYTVNQHGTTRSGSFWPGSYQN